MVFSSVIFLLWFLPISLAVVYSLPQKLKNLALLIISLVFYSWGEPVYVLVMLCSILFNYAVGNQLHKATRSRWLVLGIVGNLSLLIYFKYVGFIFGILNNLSKDSIIEIGEVYLPIGISFFTFQALSYLIDVYRKETPAQKNLINLALYISLFPQLIAGPIVRYHDINEQLNHRSVTVDKFASGIERLLIGLIKKVLLANNFAYLADQVFDGNSELDTPLAWMGALAYTFQIYFDFSGYSDMAIGLGRMFGFEILENFNYPYISRSVKEFWRRWHISLSTWFRDYLYIPLGGNRKKKTRTYLNLGIVFLLTGLWHGASWTFVIWGIYHGLFLILERQTKKFSFKLPRLFNHVYLMLVVIVGWVIFRADTVKEAFHFIQTMFTFELNPDYPNNVRYLMNKEIMIVTILAILFSMPTRPFIKDYFGSVSIPHLYKIYKQGFRLILLVLFIISLSYIAADTYNPFIYFRF